LISITDGSIFGKNCGYKNVKAVGEVNMSASLN